jgi:hypothetical protein
VLVKKPRLAISNDNSSEIDKVANFLALAPGKRDRMRQNQSAVIPLPECAPAQLLGSKKPILQPHMLEGTSEVSYARSDRVVLIL